MPSFCSALFVTVFYCCVWQSSAAFRKILVSFVWKLQWKSESTTWAWHLIIWHGVARFLSINAITIYRKKRSADKDHIVQWAFAQTFVIVALHRHRMGGGGGKQNDFFSGKWILTSAMLSWRAFVVEPPPLPPSSCSCSSRFRSSSICSVAFAFWAFRWWFWSSNSRNLLVTQSLMRAALASTALASANLKALWNKGIRNALCVNKCVAIFFPKLHLWKSTLREGMPFFLAIIQRMIRLHMTTILNLKGERLRGHRTASRAIWRIYSLPLSTRNLRNCPIYQSLQFWKKVK